MTTVHLSRYKDTLVIHFGCDEPRINAYTLASTLIGFADAAKAANSAINPGYELEVVVEALGEGSFVATLRELHHRAGNLFSKENFRGIVISVIASFVYQHTLAPDSNVNVHVNTTEVVIEQGDARVIVPRDIHDAVQELNRSPRFRKGIGDAFRSVDSDPAINTLALTPSLNETVAPQLVIPRNRFPFLAEGLETSEDEERELIEITDLQILRAILERSRRRWQFVWNGIRISAPVTDDTFYREFFAHKIKIAPGDTLRARLRVKQRRDPDLGVYINSAYEVIEVLEHRPGIRQSELHG